MDADIQLVIATKHTTLKKDFTYFLSFIYINCQTLVKIPQVQLITLHYRQLLKSRPWQSAITMSCSCLVVTELLDLPWNNECVAKLNKSRGKCMWYTNWGVGVVEIPEA